MSDMDEALKELREVEAMLEALGDHEVEINHPKARGRFLVREVMTTSAIRAALERQRKLREALEAHQPILNEAMDKLLDAGHEGFVGEDMMNRFYDNEALLAESLQNADDVMERGKRVLELWQDGWRLAPMEPTPEMLFESSLPDDLAAAEYKAMLAASPSPEESNGT